MERLPGTEARLQTILLGTEAGRERHGKVRHRIQEENGPAERKQRLWKVLGD